MARTPLPLFLLAALVLAGCTQPADDDTDPSVPESDSLALTMRDAPVIADAGAAWTFRLEVAGEGHFDSDHIGAHYWSGPVQDPTARLADAQACAHVSGGGTVPGNTFLVSCTMTEPGTFHLRGHVRLVHEGETFDYWTSGHTILVQAVETHFDLGASGVPGEAVGNIPFSFQLTIDGDAGTSDHIGAHYWTNSTADPTADFAMQAGGCAHQAGILPGIYTVTCTLTETGTYHLRGHLRVQAGGEDQNFWTSEHMVVVADVAPAHTLSAAGIPASTQADAAFTFQLTVDGDAGTSDHIGAHYWTESTTDPTGDFAMQAGGCAHTAGTLPGTFDVTCTFTETGTSHLRGHLRIQDGDATYNYWTTEHAITVGPAYTLTASGVPSSVEPGTDFQFDVDVQGEARSVDHVAAHYWTESTDDPTGDFAAQAGLCDIQSAEVPTTVTVTCNIEDEGTYYLRGHMRLQEDGVTFDHWTDEYVVTVAAGPY